MVLLSVDVPMLVSIVRQANIHDAKYIRFEYPNEKIMFDLQKDETYLDEIISDVEPKTWKHWLQVRKKHETEPEKTPVLIINASTGHELMMQVEKTATVDDGNIATVAMGDDTTVTETHIEIESRDTSSSVYNPMMAVKKEAAEIQQEVEAENEESDVFDIAALARRAAQSVLVNSDLNTLHKNIEIDDEQAADVAREVEAALVPRDGGVAALGSADGEMEDDGAAVGPDEEDVEGSEALGPESEEVGDTAEAQVYSDQPVENNEINSVFHVDDQENEMIQKILRQLVVVSCEWCGTSFFNKRSLREHQTECQLRPQDGAATEVGHETEETLAVEEEDPELSRNNINQKQQTSPRRSARKISRNKWHLLDDEIISKLKKEKEDCPKEDQVKVDDSSVPDYILPIEGSEIEDDTPPEEGILPDEKGAPPIVDKANQCRLCNRVFSCSSNVQRHIRMFRCEKVRGLKPDKSEAAKIWRENNAKRSIKTEIDDSELECGYCKNLFKTIPSLNKHMASQCPNAPENKRIKKNVEVAYMCNHCSKSFPSKKNLSSHVLRVHSVKPRKHVCTQCGMKFMTPAHLKRHLTVHGAEKEFKCSYCAKKFAERSTMLKHERLHTGDLPYLCTICGTRYNEAVSVKRCIAKHEGTMETFPCDYCDKVLTSRGNKKKHIDHVHFQLKLYTCPTCENSFASRQTLITHIKSVHTHEREYKCETCNKGFVNNWQLQQHVKIVHVGERYQCTHCGNLYTHKQKLYQHLKRTHEVEPSGILIQE